MNFPPSELCGIVLAAGDGRRLRPFIHRLRGDHLPKQYISFIGTRSMLEHTLSRAQKLIARERLFTVVARKHLAYPEVRAQLSSRARDTVVIQPENRDTGPGLLLPLMHVYRCSPNSTVVVFPSDHFILEEDLFLSHVYLAVRAVEHDPSRMVLLGVEPTEPEVDYGYIVPGEKTEDLSLSALHDVHRFVEKPDPHTALALKRAGGLWNTFVMVFRARTLLALVENIAPELYALFRRIGEAIGEAREETVVQENYRAMPCLNFSKGLLEPATVERRGCLSVLPVRGVRWSDWGSGHRIVNVLKKTGHLGRLKGISEERLFTIWSGLDRQSERSAGYKAPGRRRAYAGNS